MRYPQHRTNWGFRTSAQPGLDGRAIFYPRGKVLGGSGSINGMIAMRGQAEDFDAWADELDDDGWSWAAMRPHFERQMDYTAGPARLPRDGSPLGTGGPLEVTRQALRWDVLDQARARARARAREKESARAFALLLSSEGVCVCVCVCVRSR